VGVSVALADVLMELYQVGMGAQVVEDSRRLAETRSPI